ncbi:MAG: hypothetical protein J5850_02820 [Clostridia bacterium]|nr:hypothetical protein [Clostridia bacterium]
MSVLSSDLTCSSSNNYDKIRSLFDEGSFVEIGKYVGGNDCAGVICGYGAVNGALTFAFSQNFSRNDGAFGENESGKICSLYDMAEKSGAPIVGIFSSAGVDISQGEKAMSAFGKFLSRISKLSGIVPQIAVIDGVCAGMMAVAASMFDIIIASEKSSIYTTPASALRFSGDNKAGTPMKALENGGIDIICPDPVAKAAELLYTLPQNNSQGLSYFTAADSLDRVTSDLDSIDSMRDVITELSDCGKFEELKKDCAPEVITGLSSIGYISTGIIATQRGAVISAKGARKIASFISFCDNFMIPVLTLIDAVAFENDIDPAIVARLSSVYASSSNAKVTVYLGKAYGSVFTVLGSGSLGADVTIASEKAEISVMTPDAAVEFLYGDEIDSPVKRSELKSQWIADRATPLSMASIGEIDSVIPSCEIRKYIISAFNMLSAKADGKVNRKHSKLPF